ncbi:uncharacterized protein LOC106650993 [Trichogramma pretiosum]|uniref:uncharacterized protein LOC106650993 n=1 Tax=Trichogramma pretiosum TaxID=7493 RepID=UPI0006C942B4|nr:uncharacterized protein LOC106650993 [Trichogramma pretiosum]
MGTSLHNISTVAAESEGSTKKKATRIRNTTATPHHSPEEELPGHTVASLHLPAIGKQHRDNTIQYPAQVRDESLGAHQFLQDSDIVWLNSSASTNNTYHELNVTENHRKLHTRITEHIGSFHQHYNKCFSSSRSLLIKSQKNP